jgi:hypothetical protein
MEQVADKILELNVETNIYPVEQSVFAGGRSAEEIARKIHQTAYKRLSNTLWIDPIFYLLCTRDGKEQVLGLNLDKFVNRHPNMACALVANIMAITECHAYAVVMNCRIAQQPIRDIRAEENVWKEIPGSTCGLVVYVEHDAKTDDDDDNDSCYLVHKYGRTDDMLFWDPDPVQVETPIHCVIGRFWRLFGVHGMLKEWNELSSMTSITDKVEPHDDEI